VDAAVRFVQGVDDDATRDEMRALLLAWAMGAEDAPTRGQFRLALRDRYIRRAMYMIAAESSWAKAGILGERVLAFEVLRWPLWQHLDAVPTQADRVDALLWQARRLGELPRSQRALFRLL